MALFVLCWRSDHFLPCIFEVLKLSVRHFANPCSPLSRRPSRALRISLARSFVQLLQNTFSHLSGRLAVFPLLVHQTEGTGSTPRFPHTFRRFCLPPPALDFRPSACPSSLARWILGPFRGPTTRRVGDVGPFLAPGDQSPQQRQRSETSWREPTRWAPAPPPVHPRWAIDGRRSSTVLSGQHRASQHPALGVASRFCGPTTDRENRARPTARM